jgi:hypothetical protein
MSTLQLLVIIRVFLPKVGFLGLMGSIGGVSFFNHTGSQSLKT